jgi:hypothetical protein
MSHKIAGGLNSETWYLVEKGTLVDKYIQTYNV